MAEYTDILEKAVDDDHYSPFYLLTNHSNMILSYGKAYYFGLQIQGKMSILRKAYVLLIFFLITSACFSCNRSEPTKYTISNLSITPTTVNVGGSVTISAAVKNIGNTKGNCPITLIINDTAIERTWVILDRNQGKTITFHVSKYLTGTYKVNLCGLEDTFTVSYFNAPVTNNPTRAPPKTTTSKTANPGYPEGATAICRDGTYSYSQNHRGT
jgi:hypothetical protein